MVPKRTLRSAEFTFRTAEEAYVLTDEYQLPTYRRGYFAFGSDASGERLVRALDGDDKRPLHRLAAIGINGAAVGRETRKCLKVNIEREGLEPSSLAL
jgi:hypothetical protein